MLRAGAPLPWRKHDWPDRRWSPPPPHGHQASDSLRLSWRGTDAAVQGFDFGDGGRGFGRFDAGDGGQVLIRVPEGIAIAVTEDGAGGVQWFQRPDCTPGGWLVAGAAATTWRRAIAPLRIRPAPADCPLAPDRALTRWRLATVPFPVLRAGAPAGTHALATLVSEHFSHATVAASDHLERSWHARGLGLARWERWEAPGDPARTRDLAASGRCPDVAFSTPPGPRWRMVDCRMWTNIVPGPARPEPWPVAPHEGG